MLHSLEKHFAREDGEEISLDLNSDYKFERIDASLAMLFGKRETDLIGKSIWEISDSLPAYKYSKQFDKVILNETPKTFIHFFPEFKSWQRWLIYPKNKGVGIVIVEITEQITNYMQLKESETKLRAVIENNSESILYLDRNAKVRLFNDVARKKLFLLTDKQIEIGNYFVDFVYPDSRKIEFKKILEDVAETQKAIEYDVDYTTNERIINLHISISPVIEMHQFIGFSISATDITFQKEMLSEREKIINELLDRNRDLEQFSYIVSHNIMSSLSTLFGFVSLLKMNLSDNDIKKVHSGIEDSAKKLDTVIKDVNDILNVKKKLAQENAEVSLSALVEEIKGNIENILEKSRAKIEYDFHEVPSLKTIKPFIHSVFINLITNSIKYAKDNERPSIKIWAEKGEHMNCIYFKDNGKGVDLEKYGDQLFGLYKRFNLEVDGKGMGLYMVKTQVNALGGHIDVESKLGKGSTFRICFPV